ncbi:MAG: hypothetical protein V1721_04500 [Pseudomonadota bacterium]
METISTLLREAGEKDASALSASGKANVLSVAAREAYVESARVRLDRLNALSEDPQKPEAPQTVKAIESKVRKINDLLAAAGNAPCKLDSAGGDPDTRIVAEAAVYANGRSAWLRMTELAQIGKFMEAAERVAKKKNDPGIIEAAKGRLEEGVTDTVFHTVMETDNNLITAKSLARQHNLPDIPLPDDATKKLCKKALEYLYSVAEQSEAWTEIIIAPGFEKYTKPDKELPAGAKEKRSLFKGLLDTPTFFTGEAPTAQEIKAEVNSTTTAQSGTFWRIEEKKASLNEKTIGERLEPFKERLDALKGRVVKNSDFDAVCAEFGYDLKSIKFTPQEIDDKLAVAHGKRKDFPQPAAYLSLETAQKVLLPAFSFDLEKGVYEIDGKKAGGVLARGRLLEDKLKEHDGEMYTEIRPEIRRKAILLGDPEIIKALVTAAERCPDCSDKVGSGSLMEMSKAYAVVRESVNKKAVGVKKPSPKPA